MSFSDLAAFRLSISTWPDIGSTIPDSRLDDLIRIAENKVNKVLRVREMETALVATLGTTGTCAVPSDYIELKNAYINTSPTRKLERKTVDWIYDKYPDRVNQGTEQFVAREGANFIFGPVGTQNRVMKGIYYAKPVAMTSTINSLFSAFPEIYLFAALSEAEPFVGRDARIPVWEGKFQQYLHMANQSDKDEFLSGGPLSTTVS